MFRRNIRLLLEYDGLAYLGWQSQPEGRTVQQALESAILSLTGEECRLHASGRTDAGVHALGQVAHFSTESRLPLKAFVGGINSKVRPTIAVLEGAEVPSDFHSRYSALSKLYRYRILARPLPSPLERQRSWHVPYRLDLGALRTAAAHLRGRQDFSSFRASGCASRNPVRNLFRCDVEEEGDFLILHLEADGFLRHMVRAIAGTLVDVGCGRIPAGDLPRILRARDRRRAGPAAPPHGLFLVSVTYPQAFSTSARAQSP